MHGFHVCNLGEDSSCANSQWTSARLAFHMTYLGSNFDATC